MSFLRRGYSNNSLSSAMAPATRGFDITPGPDDLPIVPRVITVSEETTVTGVFLEGQDGTSHTTHTLQPGIYHPLMFKKITAVASGTVKGYA